MYYDWLRYFSQQQNHENTQSCFNAEIKCHFFHCSYVPIGNICCSSSSKLQSSFSVISKLVTLYTCRCKNGANKINVVCMGQDKINVVCMGQYKSNGDCSLALKPSLVVAATPFVGSEFQSLIVLWKKECGSRSSQAFSFKLA